MMEMHTDEAYHTHCFIYFLSSFQFFSNRILSIQAVMHNKYIIDYSVLKELSVCLVKEGDSLMRAEDRERFENIPVLHIAFSPSCWLLW